jgi:hypothetical protein
MRRFGFAVLFVIQAGAGGAVSLAHARDVLVAPPGIEAGHTKRCAILHDELRCALCHYAVSRVAAQQMAITLSQPLARAASVPVHLARIVPATSRSTPPPRAPPAVLS